MQNSEFRIAESRLRPGSRAAIAGGWLIALFTVVLTAQSPSPAAEGAVPASRFAGTWVGTQAWAIENPPPGASQDQAVTLDITVVDGTITGTMTPFLGGEEGASFAEAAIVGEELRAKAIIGRPRPAGGGRRGGGAGGWKEPVAVTFTFRNHGVVMTGTADVKMGDVPWMKFSYDLGKKRSRY